jgi:hypothetical protein
VRDVCPVVYVTLATYQLAMQTPVATGGSERCKKIENHANLYAHFEDKLFEGAQNWTN